VASLFNNEALIMLKLDPMKLIWGTGLVFIAALNRTIDCSRMHTCQGRTCTS
jgi:hypothetical protein